MQFEKHKTETEQDNMNADIKHLAKAINSNKSLIATTIAFATLWNIVYALIGKHAAEMPETLVIVFYWSMVVLGFAGAIAIAKLHLDGHRGENA